MRFKVTKTDIEGLLIFEPKIFFDTRGYFYESFNEKEFFDLTKQKHTFHQDNISRSKNNVLRGLHYQIKHCQGKYVSVVNGEIYDVCVDLRKQSHSFGKWIGLNLSNVNKKRLWIPPGIAHGFLVLSDYADLLYKTTDYWFPEHERVLLWNSKELKIKWPIKSEPILNEKDMLGKNFSEIEFFN